MKRKVFSLIFIVILLSACTPEMNMDTVVDEPNFSGVVEEKEEGSILVKVNEEDISSSDLISVSLDVELKDSLTDFNIGDEVRVYYDGNIAESYPAQVNKVYAIMLLSPAKTAEVRELLPTEIETLNDLEGVTMAVKEDTVSPAGLTVVFENLTDKVIVYGEDFLLEKKIDGEWFQVPIFIEEDYGFNDIGYELDPGQKEELKVEWEWLYDSLEGGKYRIIKEVLDFKRSGDYDTYNLGAEFEID